MLQNIRDRFTGRFALVILALICLPFLFFGINYDFIGSTYAAKVNGEEISMAQFENAYQQQLLRFAESGGEVPEQLREAIREGVLNNLIGEKLVDQYLAEAGYRITDEMVAQVIQSVPEFQVNGRFSRDTYYVWLAERGQTPAAFEEFQRYQLRLSQLQRGVAATAFVTPGEFRRFLNLVGEQREVRVATFDVGAIEASIDVTDDAIQTYYDERPDEFRSEESVDLRFVEVRRDALREQIEISEDELQNYYEDASGRFLQDEQRRARHILIPFGDDENAARDEAAELAERVRAGEPIADLARQHSGDTGTAEQGGDLGLLAQSQYFPDELGDAVFALREGEVAGPVRTDFGFHVIRLEEIQAGGPLPLSQVRAELERELLDGKVENAWRDIEQRLADALFDASDIGEMADDLGLEVKTASGFTRTGGAGFGSNQAMIDTVFEPSVLRERLISDIVELNANRSVVVQVASYNEAERLPLEDVRDGIADAIRSERARNIVSDRTSELQAALRDGAEFESAAETASADDVTTLTIGRQDPSSDAALSAAVFELNKPAGDDRPTGSTRTDDGDFAVFQLVNVRPGRPEAIPVAERDEGKANLAAQAGSADYAAMVLELERRADVVRNRDAVNQQTMFR
ncbi:MAG: SurA N-terminal domain-containing protein [Woeseia sp.]